MLANWAIKAPDDAESPPEATFATVGWSYDSMPLTCCKGEKKRWKSEESIIVDLADLGGNWVDAFDW